MPCVTERIKEIQQPRGGYIKPSDFTETVIDDGVTLFPSENVNPRLIGLVVDYLTRFLMNSNSQSFQKAFKYSFKGAGIAIDLGHVTSDDLVPIIGDISGLNNASIINACKFVSFDIYYRNRPKAIQRGYADFRDINPDKTTISNIKTMVQRSIKFFELNGPIIEEDFDFFPIDANEEDIIKWRKNRQGAYGGYTPVVSTGDGDYLTSDTLWEFKVSKYPLNQDYTLQLLVYWIMGQHSGQDIFKGITKLGLFNPRINVTYCLKISTIPQEVIKEVEKKVICY